MFFNLAILISLCTPYLPVSTSELAAHAYSPNQMISTSKFQLNSSDEKLYADSLNQRLAFIHNSWDKAKTNLEK